jgi:dGTPase
MQNRFYAAFDFECLEQRPVRNDEFRTPFQIHRDRIIHTSAFRRLQNKTQVFNSGHYDFYRTRLTHSIEVAQIGRSICQYLNQTSDLLAPEFLIDADLVEACCLSHDIGHPPFGHTGERELNKLMREHGGFEGNAQTLRLLTQTIFSTTGRGMNPSRALMDGVLKYKTIHHELENPECHFLYPDQAAILEFVLGGREFPDGTSAGKPKNAVRSIECQIMDWADDTAYSLNDIADGVNAGFLTPDRVESWAAQAGLEREDARFAEEVARAIREQRIEARIGKKVGQLVTSVHLIESASFLGDLSNRHRFQLSIDPAAEAETRVMKRLCFDLVFRAPQLQQLDFKASRILRELFEVLADRYVYTARPAQGMRLVPETIEQALFALQEPSSRARLICDYISTMTDGFAVRTYKRLTDPDFGSIADLV